MGKRHPLHLAVADFFKALPLDPDCRVLAGPECDGAQNLPLFCCDERHAETRFCNVDLLVVRGSEVRMIVEIEESGFLPTKICGKFLTSALSSHFIHDVLSGTRKALARQVAFLEILDPSRLPNGTRKPEQGEQLERSIQSLLPIGNVANYRLFYHRQREFETNASTLSELRRYVLAHCGAAEPGRGGHERAV